MPPSIKNFDTSEVIDYFNSKWVYLIPFGKFSNIFTEHLSKYLLQYFVSKYSKYNGLK